MTLADTAHQKQTLQDTGSSFLDYLRIKSAYSNAKLEVHHGDNAALFFIEEGLFLPFTEISLVFERTTLALRLLPQTVMPRRHLGRGAS